MPTVATCYPLAYRSPAEDAAQDGIDVDGPCGQSLNRFNDFLREALPYTLLIEGEP